MLKYLKTLDFHLFFYPLGPFKYYESYIFFLSLKEVVHKSAWVHCPLMDLCLDNFSNVVLLPLFCINLPHFELILVCLFLEYCFIYLFVFKCLTLGR